MKKFTFKTRKATGRYRSFDKDWHAIKYLGKDVGSIDDKKPHQIRLMVIKDDKIKDNNPNCTWKNIFLATKFESIQEAKDFLNDNIEKILKQFNLHLQED